MFVSNDVFIYPFMADSYLMVVKEPLRYFLWAPVLFKVFSNKPPGRCCNSLSGSGFAAMLT